MSLDTLARSRSTDPALWTVRQAFGVAGGPDEVVLTDEGNARAFAVGAQVKHGDPGRALERLAAMGGEGELCSVVPGHTSRLTLTDLGRFHNEVWSYLAALGYVDNVWAEPGVRGHGVRLTDAGRRAVDNGIAERARLLDRCINAARAAR